MSSLDKLVAAVRYNAIQDVLDVIEKLDVRYPGCDCWDRMYPVGHNDNCTRTVDLKELTDAIEELIP
jgi:hypothetical protein